MQKVTQCLILSTRSYCVFCTLGFCNQVLLDLHRVDEVKNFVANNLLQVGKLVTYWDLCNKKGGVHILKSSEVLKR